MDLSSRGRRRGRSPETTRQPRSEPRRPRGHRPWAGEDPRCRPPRQDPPGDGVVPRESPTSTAPGRFGASASLDRRPRATPPVGRELFERVWEKDDPRAHGGDGLGPVFNASSCVACHHLGGAGGAGGNDRNIAIATPTEPSAKVRATFTPSAWTSARGDSITGSGTPPAPRQARERGTPWTSARGGSSTGWGTPPGPRRAGLSARSGTAGRDPSRLPGIAERRAAPFRDRPGLQRLARVGDRPARVDPGPDHRAKPDSSVRGRPDRRRSPTRRSRRRRSESSRARRRSRGE